MKKGLIFFLIFTLLGTFIPTDAATPYFTDTNEHWAETYTETLRRLGIMNGTEFMANTDTYITRGEFSAMIARAVLDVNYNEFDVMFDDVDKTHIFAPYISAAYKSGIIKGIDTNNFAPDRYVTREQIALMLYRLNILKKSNDNLSFKDISNGYKYYKEISTCATNGVIDGYKDNTFRPYSNATRAEVAAMMVRTIMSADISISNNELKRFADNFFDNETKNIAIDAIGQAYDDLVFRNEINDMLKSYHVKKEFLNITSQITETNGMLSVVEYTGKIKFETNTFEKTYNVKKTYKIIYTKGKFSVYDINTDFSLPEKINLTWEVYNKAPAYSTPGVTHVSPSAFQLSSTREGGNEIDIGISNVKLYDNLTDSYIDYAQKNSYDIWAMYKTDFTTTTANSVLRIESAKKTIINYLLKQCLTRGISGINFDFENMKHTDKEVFYNHVREMELAMHEIGVVVSVDITRYEKTSLQWSMCYDRDRLAEYADYIMLMAYDQYYAGSKTAGPVGGLTWVEDSVKLTLSEVPAEKLVLGMPFYTRYWETKNNTVISTKAISMDSAIKLIKEHNPQMVYVAKDGQHKAIWTNNGVECSFWFETAETIGKRVDIANKYNLAGVASWRRGFETADVWTEISNKLN